MQELIIPKKDEFGDWRHNSVSSQFFFRFLSTFLEAYVEKLTSGDVLDKTSLEEIGLETIKEGTRAAIFRELYDISYEDIYQVVTGEVYEENLPSREESISP